MENIGQLVLSGILMTFINIYIWKNLINKKIIIKNKITIIILIIMPIIIALNYVYMVNYLKIITITIIFTFICKYLFKIKIQESILLVVISQLIIAVSEFIFVLIFLNCFKMDDYLIFKNYVGTLLPNLLICIIAFFLTKLGLAKKLYNFLIKITKEFKKYDFIIFILIIMITINLIEVNIYYKVNLKILLIINIFLMLLYTFIIFKMTSTRNKYLTISDKYNNSKNSLLEYQSLINKYKIDNHENKNQLLIIKSKIDSKNKEAIDYIDNALNIRIKANEKLLNKAKIIPESDLRTLIESKIINMETKQIKNNIHVDKKIETIDFIEMNKSLMEDICKIIGVYLDNAIEAVENLTQKKIGIDLYKINNEIWISVVNNFKGEVDLEQIDNPEYTTKKDGHGFGLALVKQIIENNKYISKETYIDSEIFKQILKIKNVE